MQNLAYGNKLNQVDFLRSLGIDKEVSLPQLAVVGDQSSGKSSLLEYLTGIKFPVGTNMCTTFPTAVRCRPAHSFKCKISTSRSDIACPTVTKPQGVGNAIASVKKQLGDTIAKVTLFIDLDGPEYSPLTIVDLPGYIHSPDKGMPKDVDVTIDKMVEEFISDARTIILAVIPANKDVATNIVFKKAVKYDAKGTRTLGIITKLDLMDTGTESLALDIYKGKHHYLDLGYHLIRNKNYQESTNRGLTRDVAKANERKFFKQPEWDLVIDSDKGIDALESKLVQLLREHVNAELPKVMTELSLRHTELSQELHRLGTPIVCNSDRSRLLMSSMMSFLALVKNMNSGIHYKVEDEPFRFRNKLHVLSRDYFDDILTHREYCLCLITNCQCAGATKEALKDLLVKSMGDSKGIEIDGFPSYMAFMLAFSKLTKPWHPRSMEFIEAAFHCVATSYTAMIDVTVADALKKKFILATSMALQKMKESAVTLATRNFEDEQQPATFNRHFTELVNREFQKQPLSTLALTSGTSSSGATTTQPSMANLCNEQREEAELKTKLKAYFSVAAQRYADAVTIYVVERAFLREGIETLTSEILRIQVDDISEDPSITGRRQDIQTRVNRLAQAIAQIQMGA